MRTKRQIKEPLKLKTAVPPLTEGNGRICMAEGCMCDAPYPAPRNRSELRSYIWFCLDHIRHYNSSWNYYDGIEGAAMEEEIRRATTWERPSWKFGTGPSAAAASSEPFDDKFGFFDTESQRPHPAMNGLSAEERKAWALFDLSPDTDMAEVKKRYNELAKSL
ncbi:MAG: molecular chaperone DnaJ, partial [Candidatus Puniceispirillaceae bacterium]